jgi:purine-binding chemotaxis protein CheW
MATARAAGPDDIAREPDGLEVLVFELGGQRYGVPVAAVREVVRAVTIVPLPRAPAVIEGIVNFRGTIVPVLDVRRRFRLPARPAEHTDHLVVARAGRRLVALRVDRAVDLVRLGGTDVEEARGSVPGAEYVAWVAKLPDDLVLIHDLETFLSRAEAETLDEALAPPAAGPGEGGAP